VNLFEILASAVVGGGIKSVFDYFASRTHNDRMDAVALCNALSARLDSLQAAYDRLAADNERLRIEHELLREENRKIKAEYEDKVAAIRDAYETEHRELSAKIEALSTSKER
jgi:tellurite resistance protein